MKRRSPALTILLLSVSIPAYIVGCSSAPEEPLVDHRTEKEWIKNLGMDNKQVRDEAAKRLAAAGPAGAKILVNALHDKQARLGAGEAFAAMKVAAIPVLDPIIRSDSDEEVRAVAVGALVDAGPAGFPLLQVGLKDKCTMVRFRAANALKRNSENAAEAADSLADALADSDNNVRAEAFAALIHMPIPAATKAIVAKMSSDNPQLREATANIAYHLKLFEDPQSKALIIGGLTKLLDDPSHAIRIYAAEAIHHWEPERDLKTVVDTAWSNDDIKIRILALSRVKSLLPATAALEFAGRALDDPSSDVRSVALKSMSGEFAAVSLGKNAELAPYVPKLLPFLKDDLPATRTQVATTLGSVGTNADVVVPALIELLADKDDKVRQSAARSLGKFSADAASAVDPLIAAFSNEPARWQDADGFGSAGSEPSDLATDFLYALGQIGKPAQKSAPLMIKELLAVKDIPAGPSQSAYAALTKRQVGLLQILGGVRPEDEESIKLLSEIVGNDNTHPFSRTAAAETLGNIGAPAKAAYHDLVHASRDKNDALSNAASKACYKVDPEKASEDFRSIGRQLKGF